MTRQAPIEELASSFRTDGHQSNRVTARIYILGQFGVLDSLVIRPQAHEKGQQV